MGGGGGEGVGGGGGGGGRGGGGGVVFFFKQKTAYEIKECDWSSDVCSSDLYLSAVGQDVKGAGPAEAANALAAFAKAPWEYNGGIYNGAERAQAAAKLLHEIDFAQLP